MNWLKNHPFAVEAFFERSLVLTYAVPKEELIEMIPSKLALDLFQDRWAFVAVALVQTRGLRPKGFPKFLGRNFFLIGYRIFVRYTNQKGKRLRGLYIIKSETDTRAMEYLGNMFTHYQYSTTDIGARKEGGYETIESKASAFKLKVDLSDEEVRDMPAESPFQSWMEARRFAGPLPFTFTCNEEKGTVLIIEGVRANWKPQPVTIIDHQISFLENMGLSGMNLAGAFMVEDVPYFWRKGKIEQWA